MSSLKKLAQILGAELTGDAAIEVGHITNSASDCTMGSLFVAVKGFKADGNDYIEEAVRNGAVAVISEKTRPEGCEISWLRVADARSALANAAAEVYGHPSRSLSLAGVTGTNGKTTTVYLLDSIFRIAYKHSAMLTTICNRIGEEIVESERTTPEAHNIQRLLRQAVDEGCATAAMEVSSHAIDLHRVDALEFSSVIFTNLTQDHLDYHGTMEAYYRVKRRLFDGTLNTSKAKAIINIDCSYGRRLVDETLCPVLTYGIQAGDVRALGYDLSIDGLSIDIGVLGTNFSLKSRMVGRPHVYNILAAVASAFSLGLSIDQIVAGIEALECVPGRFDRVPFDGDFAVVVDYAHTDDALTNVLATAREVANGRVICLFGCGGDRDPLKRPKMGEAAARGSDIVILTSDNPRTEDPEQILDHAEVGLKRVGKPYKRVTDRREAIGLAVSLAKRGDIVVLAGKGHENYQLIGNQKLHFDDKEAAAEALLAYR